MKTAQDTLAVARRNLGIKEGSRNWNPFAPVAGHKNNEPWCASFVTACLVRAGVLKSPPPAVGSAYCPTLKNLFKPVAKGDVRPGDVMFLYFPDMGRDAHTGFVEAVFPSYVITIEGNTDVAGGRTGGQVMRKKRAYKGLSFVRPAYAEKPPAAPKVPATYPVLRMGNRGQLVLNVQRALQKHGSRVALTANFDQATANAVFSFQKRKGLHADGVVGPNTLAALRATP